MAGGTSSPHARPVLPAGARLHAWGKSPLRYDLLCNALRGGGRASPALQCLVATGKAPHESWHFVTAENNGSPAVDSVHLPKSLLQLPVGLSHGAALTAQWPEMLVTGARTTLIGKDPAGQTRCFYAAWRFQETVYGTDNQWREVSLPSGLPATARLTAACAVDQHTTQQPQGPRLSRFLLDFSGFQDDSATFILQIAASTTFPALAAVALTPKERGRATRLFAALAAHTEEEWESRFRKASALEFPQPPAGGCLDCAGIQKVFLQGHDALAGAFTELYGSSWLGKILLPDWQSAREGSEGAEGAEGAFVVNKFSELGHKILHLSCPWQAGVELTGRIRRGASVLDGNACFVLTYGCQAGRKVLPTVPPVPLEPFAMSCGGSM